MDEIPAVAVPVFEADAFRGLGPGLFLRLLMLTAAPPSAEDCVIWPGASRLGRWDAAVWGVVVWALGVGSGGAGVDLLAGVDVWRDERVGSVVVIEFGSSERRMEWRDGGRERAGGVVSGLKVMDVRRVEEALAGKELGVESGDSVEDGAGRLILSGIFVVSVCEFDNGVCLGPGFGFFFGEVDVSAEGDIAMFESSSFLFLLVFFPVDLVPLAIGELIEPFKFARALPSGLKRFLKADPISPSLLAAASASAAARAACSRAKASRFNFLASFSFIPRLRTAAKFNAGDRYRNISCIMHEELDFVS